MTSSRKPESKSYIVYLKPQKIKDFQDKESAKIQKSNNKGKVKVSSLTLLKIKSKTKKSSAKTNENDNKQNKKVANRKIIRKLKHKDDKDKIKEKREQKLALLGNTFTPPQETKSKATHIANINIKKSTASSSSSNIEDSSFVLQSSTRVPPPLVNQNKALFQLHSKPKFIYNHGIIGKLPLAPEDIKWSHRIRLAIAEGGSPNPQENQYLKKLILQSVDENFPWPSLERILENCGVPQKISYNCFLIQLRFQSIIDIICCVRTNNIVALKKSMLPLLKEYKASFESVINNFKHSCYIEALASYRTPINFFNFERQLAKDAVDCKAKVVEIIDYETGAVHFECHPLQLADVVQQLEQKNYKILYADYGMSSVEKVELTEDKRISYMNFLCKLRSFKEIKNIVDNVRVSTEVEDDVGDNVKDDIKKFR